MPKKFFLTFLSLIVVSFSLYFYLYPYLKSRPPIPSTSIDTTTPTQDFQSGHFFPSISPSAIPFQFSSNKAVLEDQLNSLLDSANYCSVDSDCSPLYLGCPFGCYRLVNQTVDLTLIREGVKHYNTGGPQCVYECYEPPTALVCQAGKCLVN